MLFRQISVWSVPAVSRARFLCSFLGTKVNLLWSACATSGRSCSAACRLFFEGDGVALEEAAQRSFRRLEPNLLLAPGDDRLQRQVRLGAGELQEPIGMRLQRRTGLAAARPWRYAIQPHQFCRASNHAFCFIRVVGMICASVDGFISASRLMAVARVAFSALPSSNRNCRGRPYARITSRSGARLSHILRNSSWMNARPVQELSTLSAASTITGACSM